MQRGESAVLAMRMVANVLAVKAGGTVSTAGADETSSANPRPSSRGSLELKGSGDLSPLADEEEQSLG